MPDYNKLDIIGHVGQEPEMRFTPNGRAVTNFSVAVNRKYTTSNGQRLDETEWFNVVCWGKLAETANQFIRKGNTLFVSGRIHLHHWENNEGVPRSRLQLNATTVVFLTPKSTDNGYDLPAELQDDGIEYLEDDIPD